MLLTGLFALALAGWASATKTLVLVDTLATRETHSIFLKALTGNDNYFFFTIISFLNFFY